MPESFEFYRTMQTKEDKCFLNFILRTAVTIRTIDSLKKVTEGVHEKSR